jgi:hypothetical protein
MKRRVLIGMLLAFVVVLTVLGIRSTQRAHVRDIARASALREAGLSLPPTSTKSVVHVQCTTLFCGIRIQFNAKQGDIAAWVARSPGIGTASLRVLASGIREYTLAKEAGKEPASIVGVDEGNGEVVIDVAIARDRCTEICGVW